MNKTTLEERFDNIYKYIHDHPNTIEDVELRWQESLVLIKQELQQERERIVAKAEEIIQRDRFSGAPFAVNELIKAINQDHE